MNPVASSRQVSRPCRRRLITALLFLVVIFLLSREVILKIENLNFLTEFITEMKRKPRKRGVVLCLEGFDWLKTRVITTPSIIIC